MNSNVSTVIEDQIYHENDILLRRLAPFSAFRLQDLQNLMCLNGNTPREDHSGLLNLKNFTRSEIQNHEVLKKEKPTEKCSDMVVNGKEINDAPIEYTVKGLKSYELPVIGVYVHGKINPGFPYRVRYIGSQRYMFGGEARCLESIGMGYGKRITFSGDTLNHNDAYFWSDSHPDGFAFSIEAVKKHDKFIIQNSQGETIGEATVDSADENQTEISTEIVDGAVTKRVHVTVECSINFYQKHHGLLDLHFTNFETINGTAVLTKPNRVKRAKLIQIDNVFIPQYGQCSLYKEG